MTKLNVKDFLGGLKTKYDPMKIFAFTVHVCKFPKEVIQLICLAFIPCTLLNHKQNEWKNCDL